MARLSGRGFFKYGYMSHFMSEKEHFQENADSVEEMLSNFTNSNKQISELLGSWGLHIIAV